MIRRLVLPALAGILIACSGNPERNSGKSDPHLIREVFVTALSPADNIDSIATWTAPTGAVWVIATAKDSGRLVVFDGDSGATVRSFGTIGTRPGEFMRPNGIAVHGDLVFVVERDNHRVQVLRLPEFSTAGLFGAEDLIKPYGLWIHEASPQELQIDVTDSYQRSDGSPPALKELDRRVKRFRVRLGPQGVEDARLESQYGDTSEEGAVRWIESIVGDPLHDQILIPEEFIDAEPGEIRLYHLDGRFRGANFGQGLFGGQPEGLVLQGCDDGGGWWIATDQQVDSNRFHVFERGSLAHHGSFRGAIVQFTDGVALHPWPTARFPAGAFYAVHLDQGVAAFDWREVADAVGFAPVCSD